MGPTAFTVVFDACVLHPAPLRDLLMHLAITGLFRARWTDLINEEWIRSVIDRTGIAREKLERTRTLMDKAVPDCLITGYEKIIDSLTLPDPDDRHVLAAAIIGRADTIVTANLKDFPDERLKAYGIEPQHPDDFVLCQFDLNEAAVLGAVRQQRANLKNPPMVVEAFLDSLARCELPGTVTRLRSYAKLI